MQSKSAIGNKLKNTHISFLCKKSDHTHYGLKFRARGTISLRRNLSVKATSPAVYQVSEPIRNPQPLRDTPS